MNTAHRLADSFRSVVSYWSPTPSASQFVEKGQLTPTEFVDAGDQLTFKFPTWRWCPAEQRRRVCWLPPNKQYLATYGVACRNRLRSLDALIDSSIELDNLIGDSWLLSHSDEATEVDVQNHMTIMPTNNNLPVGSPLWPEVVCFDDIDEMLKNDDDHAAVVTSDGMTDNKDVCLPEGSRPGPLSVLGIRTTRSYDLSVTYDKYYQTPRLWLKGYNEEGLPLNSEEIFEDILSDYVSKTVTIDPHPCTGELTVSIHPCRHAAMMKNVVDGWIAHNVADRKSVV